MGISYGWFGVSKGWWSVRIPRSLYRNIGRIQNCKTLRLSNLATEHPPWDEISSEPCPPFMNELKILSYSIPFTSELSSKLIYTWYFIAQKNASPLRNSLRQHWWCSKHKLALIPLLFSTFQNIVDGRNPEPVGGLSRYNPYHLQRVIVRSR